MMIYLIALIASVGIVVGVIADSVDPCGLGGQHETAECKKDGE